MRTKQSTKKTRTLVVVALFCALAYLCVFILHIPVAFLTYDAKDAMITVAGMCLGPVAALSLSLTVPFLEFLSISGTGVYGLLMNAAASMAFSLPASLIYRRRKTMTGAVAGLLTGVVSMTAVMLGMNMWITPLFTGMPVGEVADMIPTLLLPFNLVKAILNASLVLVLYKPLTTALCRARLLESHGMAATYRFDRRSRVVLIVGVLLIAACVAAFLCLLDGNFRLWK